MANPVQPTTNEPSIDPLVGKSSPAASWGEILLAALPFLLILLANILPKLLVDGGLLDWEDALMQALSISLILLMVGSLLGALFLAWRRRWPVWSATWVPFFCLPLLLLAVGLLNWFTQGKLTLTISQEMVMYVWVPLYVAVLLYLVTRLDPLRGLLAAMPVIYLLWIPNMEFVPDWIEVAIKIPSLALICLTIAFLLRRGDWRLGLYAILGMNLVLGALFSYAGIFHGGTLPFTASGPNMLEVIRSLIPQYLATGAILLGPLFAWRFRQAGHHAGRGGIIAYHLLLAGLLLVIMANLAGLSRAMQADNPASTASNAMSPWVWLGLGLYLAGVVWLYRYRAFPGTAYEWADAILLPLLPLGIPIALVLPFLTWRWPISNLYGIPLLWLLPHAVSLTLGLLWLGLSVWVIILSPLSIHPPHPRQPCYNS
jgi:hypothetical protein